VTTVVFVYLENVLTLMLVNIQSKRVTRLIWPILDNSKTINVFIKLGQDCVLWWKVRWCL